MDIIHYSLFTIHYIRCYAVAPQQVAIAKQVETVVGVFPLHVAVGIDKA